VSSNADTIAAIATSSGRGGVGIIRVSGNNIIPLAQGILGKLPAPRYATLSNFLDANGEVIDQGIVILFKSPHSFTGEDVLELQGHGGPVVLQLLLNRCIDLGARLAEPGEFTRRAFLNEKLDLAQAESVADLIEANTAEAVRSAVRSLSGEFSSAIQELINQLIQLRMLVEAMLDFPEEEIEVVDIEKRNFLLKQIQNSLQLTLESAKQGTLLREGAHIVIIGQPNVGKSSLLNRLSGEEVALVSNIPGTTRDVIRQAIQIRGVPLHIVDTAGLRESQDLVENMGIERTHQTIQKADLIFFILDASQGLTSQDETIIANLPTDTPKLLVFNKVDLGHTSISSDTLLNHQYVYISAKTGEGLEELRDKILKLVGWRDHESGVYMARERHLRSLRTAQDHLNQANETQHSMELFADDLRMAQESLGEITGKFTSDDLLGEIFTRFCIGK